MGDDDHRRISEHTEAAPLDPVALTLALWLGLVVSVAAVDRLSKAAIAQAALQAEQGTPSAAPSLTAPHSMRFFAYGA